MEIEYVTHASLMIRGHGYTLLTDPFYFLDDLVRSVMCHFPPRELDVAHFGELDYVYSSHVHPDHSHPETLSRLRGRIHKVLLPAERPDLIDRYRRLGFTEILTLENGRTVRLADDLEVTSFWDSAVDSVLVVRAEDQVLFHQNDCRLKMRTVSEISSRFAVDYAFLNYTWIQDPYPLLLRRPEAELSRLMEEKERDCLAYQSALIDILRPAVVVPYSMTMTYFQPEQLHLNGYGRLTPSVFASLVAKERPEVTCWVLQPGDVIDCGSRSVGRIREENLWGTDLPEYLANVASYARANRDRLPRFVFGDPDDHEQSLQSYFETRLSQPFVPHLAGRQVVLRVVGDEKTISYEIDLARRRFSRANVGDTPADLEIAMPATILGALLAKVCDPFSALFTYRITFSLPGDGNLPPQHEVWMHVLSLVSLFRVDMQDELLAQKVI
jgi:UDP-MurNAc hydroxylase